MKRIIIKIEGMKKTEIDGKFIVDDGEIDVYNQALDDVIEMIKENK